MRVTIAILSSILMILGCSSCKEKECNDPSNPECPNYVPPNSVDPCLSQEPTTASFAIEQRTSTAANFIYTETASIIASDFRKVRFRALDTTANYIWHLGAEVITEQQFERVFPEDLIGQSLSIMLVISKDPNLDCFSYDNGIDTLVKSFQIIEPCDVAMASRYFGSWESSPLDSFEIEFILQDEVIGSNTYACSSWSAINLDLTGDTCPLSSNSYNNNYLSFDGEDCLFPTGEAILNENLNTIKIDYRLFPGFTAPIEEWPLYHFKGRRIF